MATRPSYFRERARNPYLRARPPAPGLEEENPNASPPAPTDFLATSPRRAVAPPAAQAFDPAGVTAAILPLLARGGAAQDVSSDVGSLAFLPPPAETFATPPPRAVAPPSGVPGGERATIPGMPAPAPEPTPAPTLDIQRAEYMAKAPTTTKGRILQALANAGLGALQAAGRDRENPLGAALGGAAAGGLISAVNPRYGRAYQFEQFRRPEIEAREAREQELLRRRRAEEDRALNAEYRRAQIGEIGSQNAARAGSLAVAQENARRQAAIAESQIALNRAREEAARTGNPSYVDIDEGDGKVTKYQVFPNGTIRPVGASGAAAISRANIKSREGIAARREAGANARAARREAGGQTKKVATIDDIDAAVKASGLSELEVKKRFIEKGYRIVEE